MDSSLREAGTLAARRRAPRLNRSPHPRQQHKRQKWKKHWPLPSESDRPTEELEVEREAAVNRLGNLTLVTDRLNPSLSNAAWSKKRPELAKHSLLAMNQALVEAYADGFDDRSIRARGDELARHILAVWPGPAPVA